MKRHPSERELMRMGMVERSVVWTGMTMRLSHLESLLASASEYRWPASAWDAVGGEIDELRRLINAAEVMGVADPNDFLLDCPS